MDESIIIQKLIQVGQMLERDELEYSGAEADIKHYLEQYLTLRQPPNKADVSGSLPLPYTCPACDGECKTEFVEVYRCTDCTNVYPERQ